MTVVRLPRATASVGAPSSGGVAKAEARALHTFAAEPGLSAVRPLCFDGPRLEVEPLCMPIDACVRTMSPYRLKLVDGTFALLSAALEGSNALERVLGVSVAEGWEGFPDALPIVRASYETSPEGHLWGSLFFIEPEGPTLVGFGGFKGSPSPDGVVEIGYAVAPAFRGRGLATDAVAQMVQRAFGDVAVRAVDAHTLGHDNPSTRVLQRTGFQKIAEIEDPDEGPIWQWRLERPIR
jgi:[ribosomal protein S5]-alanine N-acetyltransferase